MGYFSIYYFCKSDLVFYIFFIFFYEFSLKIASVTLPTNSFISERRLLKKYGYFSYKLSLSLSLSVYLSNLYLFLHMAAPPLLEGKGSCWGVEGGVGRVFNEIDAREAHEIFLLFVIFLPCMKRF